MHRFLGVAIFLSVTLAPSLGAAIDFPDASYKALPCRPTIACTADIAGMNLWARYGRADGAPFDADEFLRQHPQWNWQKGYLKSRPQQPWTYVTGMDTEG